MALLDCVQMSKRFGGVPALQDVSFSLNKGEIVGLIGPNGAGKTTLFNLVAGAIKPTEGRVFLKEIDITGLPAHRICRFGIGRTFQVTRPFAELTCLENVGVAIINRPRKLKGESWREKGMEYLEQVGLLQEAQTRAGDLNLIAKKKLEMARALASNPEILLLDEVLGGLNTQEIGQAVSIIKGLRDALGITLLWIEHIMGAIMGAADRIILLDQGRKLLEGTPAEVVRDERAIRAYLGED